MDRAAVLRRLQDAGYRIGVPQRQFDAWIGNGRDLSAPLVVRPEASPRPYLAREWVGSEVWIAFPDGRDVYLVPHDELLAVAEGRGLVTRTRSWREPPHLYHWPVVSDWMRSELAEFRL